MLKRLIQAAEASQDEVRDVERVEIVMGKKIDELDVLERWAALPQERIAKYYEVIEFETRGLQALLVSETLAVKLGTHLVVLDLTVADWIAQWDKDGDGRITLPEMTKALLGIGIVEAGREGKLGKKDEKHVQALFDELDLDGDGRMTQKELRQALKKLTYLATSFNADRKSHEVMIQLTKEAVRSAEEAVKLVLDADQDDDDLVAKLKEKQNFEFRLGDLFRKKNVAAVMR
eukprot:1769467-Prymnesium_polylepis.1